MGAGRIYCHDAETVAKLDVKKSDQDLGIRRMRSASNAGLVFERYLDVWEDGSNVPSVVKDKPRHDGLKTFAEDFNARGRAENALVHKLLSMVHARQSRVVQRRKGTSFQVTLESRFATGLGSFHPTEVGFTFERTLGIPYLPGSSVKGLARAAADLLGESLCEELFGPARIDEDSNARMGDLVFLDAYPSSWPNLAVDIINCHHQGYYGGNGVPPLESDDPIPVYFLTVAPGTKWTFRILSRFGQYAGRGAELLQEGLKHLGAGAKTAVGYGMFGD